MTNSKGFMTRYWGWIKNQIVQEVPEDIAACEFDCPCVSECRKSQCARGEWETRERHLDGAVWWIGSAISAPVTEVFDTEEIHGIS